MNWPSAENPMDNPACCASTRWVLQGAWRFALVSVVGFSVWAFAGNWFHSYGGEAGLFAASTLVFMSVAGLLMHPLVKGPRSLARFYAIFVPAFLVYGLVWSGSWFLLRFGAGLGYAFYAFQVAPHSEEASRKGRQGRQED